MFQTHLVSVKLKASNTLILHFHSAAKLARQLEEKYGRVRAGSTNLGDPSRVYVRKAQYGWRWDWGPELMSCGPYRPITLKTYTAKFGDVLAGADATLEDEGGLLNIVAVVDGTSSGLMVRAAISRPGGQVFREEVVSPDAEINWKFSKYTIKWWWPVGYGEQVLYDVKLELIGPVCTVLTYQWKPKLMSYRTVVSSTAHPSGLDSGMSSSFRKN